MDREHLPDDTHLIVTLGSKGVSWGGTIFQPQLVKVFDVCGAGDTFLAALVYEFLKHQNMQKSIDLANRAAAITVTHPGAYYLSQEDIESLYGGRNGKEIGSDALQIAGMDARASL